MHREGWRGKEHTVRELGRVPEERAIWYMQTMCNHAGLHRVHRFGLDILQACVHQRQTREEEPPRSQQAALKMAIEKQTTHATWTQPSTDLSKGSVSIS